jgi:hypothetical protein
MVNLSFIDASHVSTPSFRVCSSSTKGCMKTLKLFPRCSGPGITRERKMYSGLMATPCGRLYGKTNTGQQEYEAAMGPYGVMPSHAFLGSSANSGKSTSNCAKLHHHMGGPFY